MELSIENSDHNEAWQMVLGQLRSDMRNVDYETWVKFIVPLGFNGKPDTFRLAVVNKYNKDLIESRLNSRISRLLSGVYKRDVDLEVVIMNKFADNEDSDSKLPPQQVEQQKKIQLPPPEKKSKKASQVGSDMDEDQDLPANSKRKVVLQRAYGDERASIIQPDKTVYVTKYFLEKWLPLLGHSALIVIMMTRKVCYWNPYTGEKRDILETEMGELAKQACISVRTLKTVLKNDLVKRYFIRYTVRRVMTPNGIRTAGIRLQVRMDDPLTPQDQEMWIKTMSESLKSTGTLVTIDPLKYNPAINWYRNKAEDVRTIDEEPLGFDILKIYQRHFGTVEHKEFWLTTLWLFISYYFIRRYDPNKIRYWKKIFKEKESKIGWWFKPFKAIDKLLLSIPGIKKMAWNIVIIAKK